MFVDLILSRLASKLAPPAKPAFLGSWLAQNLFEICRFLANSIMFFFQLICWRDRVCSIFWSPTPVAANSAWNDMRPQNCSATPPSMNSFDVSSASISVFPWIAYAQRFSSVASFVLATPIYQLCRPGTHPIFSNLAFSWPTHFHNRFSCKSEMDFLLSSMYPNFTILRKMPQYFPYLPNYYFSNQVLPIWVKIRDWRSFSCIISDCPQDWNNSTFSNFGCLI